MIILAAALSVAEVMERAGKLLEAQQNKTAAEVHALDRRIMALAPQVTKHGYKAIPDLSRLAQDHSRPPKLRLYAVSFLGLIRDPLAAKALSDVAADAKQPLWVRSTAVTSLAGLPGARLGLCKALDLKEARVEVAKLGCESPAPLRPHALAGDVHAIAALARTPGLDSVRLLLELLDRRPLLPLRRFPADSPQSAAALRALSVRIGELRGLGERAARPVWDTLRHGELSPEVVAAGIPLIAALEPEGGHAMLMTLLDNREPSAVVAAAEALAKHRYEPALPKLRALIEDALNDPRFGPRKDAGVLLSRLEQAEKELRSKPRPDDFEP